MHPADLIDAGIAADLGLTVQALRARRAARAAAYALPREPELSDDYLERCEVCHACRLFHPIDDDCPAPPRHYVD